MGETIIKILVTVALAGVVIALLPSTPFTAIISNIDELPHIGEINWLIPVGRIIGITMVWATTCVSYFAISWILRQLDIIGA